MPKEPNRLEDWFWKPFELLQAAFHKGSRENIMLGAILCTVIAAVMILNAILNAGL